MHRIHATGSFSVETSLQVSRLGTIFGSVIRKVLQIVGDYLPFDAKANLIELIEHCFED